jgi:hypothetical protein
MIPLILIGVCIHVSAFAQWTQQIIHLEPGWNAVYIEVDPQPRDCDSIFRDIPIESVWGWNRRFTSVQFVQDPNTLVPDQPEWLTYFPSYSPQAFLTKLYIIQGGRPYLIKLGGTQSADIVLLGRPKIRPIQWLADSFNFVGFHVDSVAPPTFGAMFAPSPAHAGQDVFRIGANGRWQKVPTSDKLRPGEAYWVYCKGESIYQGPLGIKFDVGDGLDYARILIEQTLTIKNASASARTITLEQKASGYPPDPSLPAMAGAVPLSFFEQDVPNKKYDWKPVTGRLSLTLAPGQELALRLAVRRPDMAGFTPPFGREALYQSLLEVKDGAGSLLVLPVSAQGLGAPRIRAAGTSPGRGSRGTSAVKFDSTPPHIRTGLWIGSVSVNNVSNPTSGSLDPTRPLPTASPFTFRLIVHVDATGQARLLQQVLQMWKEGAWIPNPDDPTSATYILDPNNPGRTVLLTDDSLIPRFSGVGLRDVKLVGRRISSAAFGFRQPIAMGGGEFGVADGDPATCTIALDYQDPANPFKHKYHPDHDNWDERYEKALGEGKETYTVIRTVALQFTSADPESRVTAGWGDEELGGFYQETIWGIHRSAIHVRGTFLLQRVSDVGVLNDGLR